MATGKIKGVLYRKGETVTLGSESKPFYKREFILEEKEFHGPSKKWYTNFVKIFVTGPDTFILDDFEAGDMIEVSYKIRGSRWKNKAGEDVFFTELNTDFIMHISEEDLIHGHKKHNNKSVKLGETGLFPDESKSLDMAIKLDSRHDPGEEETDDLPF